VGCEGLDMYLRLGRQGIHSEIWWGSGYLGDQEGTWRIIVRWIFVSMGCG